jgi:ketosteroid isomerase-like protein
MSEANVARVRSGIDAFNRRDFGAALALLSDDIEWDRFLSRTESRMPVVRGKEELRAVWESQVEAVDIQLEPEEFIAMGDKVVVPVRMVGRGSTSDIPLSTPVTWVWTINEDGLASRVQAFGTLDEALAAID